MFLSFTGPQEAARLSDLMAQEWRRRLSRWQAADKIVLFDEARAILARAVLAFAGIPFDEAEASRRMRELSAMVEGAGSVGPRNWRGQVLRARSEAWARGVIRRVRSGVLGVPADAPVRVIAAHRDQDGTLLDVREAAVELLNLLRPTVAVAHFIVFAALALHMHPETRQRIAEGDEDYLHAFVEEVRRTAPFFPLIGGRVRQPFAWRGHRFARGDWVLLDLYGTNHDPRRWEQPHAFRPERLIERPPGLYDFVPQGGGEVARSHRCPGEGLAVALTKTAVRLLATAMRYELPAQDLTVDLARMPALPKSRLIIGNIRPVTGAA
jgi:fatty-acid peroxygenase